MINKISFKNYKAFLQGELKIKPITILLGANSVGKSSIMQLFLMLQETAISEGNYKSALKLHGSFISLGEGLNLIRKKDKAKILTLSIDFTDSNIVKEIEENYFTTYCHEFFLFAATIKKFYGEGDEERGFFQKFKDLFSKKVDPTYQFLRMRELRENPALFNKENFYDLVNSTYDLISKVDVNKMPKELQDEDYFYTRHYYSGLRKPTNHFKVLKERKEEYLLTYDFLKGLIDDSKNSNFTINYDVTIRDKLLIIKKISLFTGSSEIISADFDINSQSDKPIFIKSKYFEKDKLKDNSKQSIRDIFTNSRTVFSFIADVIDKDEKKHSVIGSILKPILQSFCKVASDYFTNDNINYVSPLRAHPKRYYFLDKAKINAYVDTLDGDAIAEKLKGNITLKKQVNSWFEKFNLAIEVNPLEDIIHKLVVNQNALNLDITDVGFGISQILPVIIQGFLSHEKSLTLIEQPEIHLHPKMQADLADLFIDIVINKKSKTQNPAKFLLIETHSEYLLKRLRRRISEGVISAQNVAIYVIDPPIGDEGAILRELKVQEHGQFDWPVDFYGGELLKDTVEYIKNQQKII